MPPKSIVAAVLAVAVASHSRSDELLQMEPVWEYATRHRLAIVPVQIDLRAAGPRASELAAQRATESLESWLRRCGAFDIAGPEVGRSIADAHHLPRVAETPLGQRALPEKFAPQVDAVVIATLTSANMDMAPTRVERAKYEMGDDHIERDSLNRPIVLGREEVTVLRKSARVTGLVQVLDAKTGIVLLRHESVPVEIVHENIAPDATAGSLALLERAADQLGADWARQVGPTRIKVDFDNDMLVTAHAWVDDRYDESKKISPGQGQFIAAVRNLPSSAARLPFVLALRDDDGKQIWQQGFAWTDDGRASRGAWFVLPVQLLKDSGDEKFVLELFGPGVNKPLARRKIELKTP